MDPIHSLGGQTPSHDKGETHDPARIGAFFDEHGLAFFAHLAR